MSQIEPESAVCRYRVLAVDHDLLSFADLKFEQWPVVLVTNPKDAQYMHPGAEPLGRVRRSTHIRFVCTENASISCPSPSRECGRGGYLQRGDAVLFNRILAFSEAPITAVRVSIDGDPLGKGHSAGGPLYVLPWDPSLYLKGLHTIQVKVEVGGGHAPGFPSLKLQG